MRRLVIAAALAGSAGAAWGQTPPPMLYGPDSRLVYPEAPAPEPPHGPLCYPATSCPARPYTPADLARLRHAEWLLLDSDAMTPWEFKMLIETRVANDIAAGVSPEALEAKTREGE